MKNHQSYLVSRFGRLLDVHPSGYYAWIKTPKSIRQKESEQLSGLIKKFFLESDCVYGYRKIHRVLRDKGESIVVKIVCIAL